MLVFMYGKLHPDRGLRAALHTLDERVYGVVQLGCQLTQSCPVRESLQFKCVRSFVIFTNHPLP